jgi:hypothetical protein
MSKSAEQFKKEGLGERASRFLRNINALGAVAFTGAAVLFPAYSAPLLAFAAVDVVQVGFFEGTRRMSRRRARKTQLSTA